MKVSLTKSYTSVALMSVKNGHDNKTDHSKIHGIM